MLIRKGTIQDAKAIAAIYNDCILHGTATFDIHEKKLSEIEAWIKAHNSPHHPLLVADIDGIAVGFASLLPYREKEAFYSTVELSLYVAKDFRQKGIGNALMNSIIYKAKSTKSIHVIVSVITSKNKASATLHKKYGFTLAGTMKEVGYKFGSFLSIDNYYLIV